MKLKGTLIIALSCILLLAGCQSKDKEEPEKETIKTVTVDLIQKENSVSFSNTMSFDKLKKGSVYVIDLSIFAGNDEEDFLIADKDGNPLTKKIYFKADKKGELVDENAISSNSKDKVNGTIEYTVTINLDEILNTQHDIVKEANKVRIKEVVNLHTGEAGENIIQEEPKESEKTEKEPVEDDKKEIEDTVDTDNLKDSQITPLEIQKVAQSFIDQYYPNSDGKVLIFKGYLNYGEIRMDSTLVITMKDKKEIAVKVVNPIEVNGNYEESLSQKGEFYTVVQGAAIQDVDLAKIVKIVVEN